MKPLSVDEHSPTVTPPEPADRANMYGFLSGVFLRPPETELLQSLSELDLFEGLSLLYGRSCAPRSEAPLFGESLGKNPEALKQEYMDLFAVPTSRYVFPFEDVYRGTVKNGSAERKGPLLGPCAVAVKSLYRQAGAQMDPACKELPTHIGVELSFMRFLCQKEAEVRGELRAQASPCGAGNGENGPLEGSRRLQLVFLTEHLNEWFPELSRSIQANASSQFYRSLALFAEQFISWDTTSLVEGLHNRIE